MSEGRSTGRAAVLVFFGAVLIAGCAMLAAISSVPVLARIETLSVPVAVVPISTTVAGRAGSQTGGAFPATPASTSTIRKIPDESRAPSLAPLRIPSRNPTHTLDEKVADPPMSGGDDYARGIIAPAPAFPPGRGRALQPLPSPINLRPLKSVAPVPTPLAIPPLTNDGISRMYCAGGEPDNRQCTFTNACWNLHGMDWPQHRLELYAPSNANRCLKSSGPDSVETCHGVTDWIWPGTVRSSTCQYRSTILDGPIKTETVAAWLDEKVLVFNRHYPDNYAHAVCDDFFAIFVLLQREFGWTPESAQEWVAAGFAPLDMKAPPADVVAAATAGTGPKYYSLIFADFAGGPGYGVNRLFARIFPNVRQLAPQKFDEHFDTSGERPRVCFKSVYMGAAGLSMVRNSSY